MSVAGPHPKEVRPHRYGFAERFYLTLIPGLMVTLRHFLRNLFRRGRTYTIQYPEENRPVSERYRGIHILTAREDGSPKCVACYMCATVCPAECIYIEAGERPEKAIEKYPTRFEIDLYGRDQTRTQRFPVKGSVKLGCNIHDEMRGYIRVTDTPFAGKTDANGYVTLRGASSGSARMTVWHPRLRAPRNELRESIRVAPGAQTKKVTVRLR